MKSMTGYGYAELQNEQVQITLEIKSYNNRYREINVNMPYFLNPLEIRMRDYISDKIQRGKIEMSLRVFELEENSKIIIDKNIAQEYAGQLETLIDHLGLEDKVRLNHLLRMEGIIKTEKNRDVEAYWERIIPLLDEAFQEYEERRIQEGKKTRDDILANIEELDTTLNEIKEHAPEIEEKTKDTLRNKFKEVIGDFTDENRILSEIAVYLVKYDVNEELTRISSHLEQFRSTITEGGAVGKRLDFLCQELHREINTIGSKSALTTISQRVVHMKDALEKIREQLKNVE